MIGLAVGKEQFLNDAIEVMDYMMSINVQDLPPDDPSVPYLVGNRSNLVMAEAPRCRLRRPPFRHRWLSHLVLLCW